MTGDPLLSGQTVYVDVNGDGTDDAGDLTATSDGSGAYTIADVPAGTFSLRLVTATGATLTEPAAGFDTVTVTGGSALTENFGLSAASPLPPVPTTGTIAGTVFTDANGNGTEDAGEAGLAGITVFLDAAGTGLLEAGVTSVVTDSAGAFTFPDLAAGSYTVRANVPDGEAVTTPTGGSAAATVTVGGTATVGPFGLEPVATAATAPPLSMVVVATKGPTTFVGGTKGTLRVKVTNTSGATFSGPLTFDLAASVDGSVSAADVPAGSFSVRKVTLKAGRSETLTLKFTYPSPATGKYYITATLPFATTLAPTTGATADATAATAAPVTIEFPTVDLAASFIAPTAGVKLTAGKKAVAP